MANTALRTIFEAVGDPEKIEVVSESLASFAVGAGVYDILFRNAGPDENGALKPQAVADNVLVVSGGSDPENVLRQMLNEYVSFALFSAGAVLENEQEAELNRAVGPLMAQFRPDA